MHRETQIARRSATDIILLADGGDILSEQTFGTSQPWESKTVTSLRRDIHVQCKHTAALSALCKLLFHVNYLGRKMCLLLKGLEKKLIT